MPRMRSCTRSGRRRSMRAAWRASMGGGAKRQDPAALGRIAAGFLARADGPRIAMIETGGWDTHSGQNARLATQLKGLDSLIAALRDGLGSRLGADGDPGRHRVRPHRGRQRHRRHRPRHRRGRDAGRRRRPGRPRHRRLAGACAGEPARRSRPQANAGTGPADGLGVRRGVRARARSHGALLFPDSVRGQSMQKLLRA